MKGIAVGQPAPPLRLPSAAGREVGLDDFRGRMHVIVWFTKGMACPFCRSQMSQLARGYPDFQRLGAEVLEVSLSKPDRARVYAQKFKLPFPYLCDPDYRAHREWNLGYREQGALQYVASFVQGMRMKPPPNDFGNFMPPIDEMANLLTHDDMGFFIVDREGMVRYSLAGAYHGETMRDRPIPSNEEVVRELEKL